MMSPFQINDKKIRVSDQTEGQGACRSCAELRRQIIDLNRRVENLFRAREQVLVELLEKDYLEKTLRENSEALAKSNWDLDQFASVAAHDLQEPIHSILVFLDLLQVKCGSQISSLGLGYISRASQAAKRMQRQVEGLLVYSRVGTCPFEQESVALGPLCQSIVADLEGIIRETGGCVRVEDLPTIPGHAVHFRQLFQNLIVNGLKFHRRNHPPVVVVRGGIMEDRRGRGQSSPQVLCWVEVKDQGIGIPKEQQRKIFGMFQRLHRREEFEGMGIGLAVCRRIVDHYGGGISVRSSLGKGSTFTVTLPAGMRGETAS